MHPPKSLSFVVRQKSLKMHSPYSLNSAHQAGKGSSSGQADFPSKSKASTLGQGSLNA